MIHQLKLEGLDFADAVLEEDKVYEIRKDDRCFSVGDMLYQALYDKHTGRYVRHSVADDMYIVTFKSEIEFDCEKYCVLSIHRSCKTIKVLKALARKFSVEQVVCSITTYDNRTYDNVDIEHIGEDMILANVNGRPETINFDNIVWIAPSGESEVSARSISYKSIDFLGLVDERDFKKTRHFDMFLMRESIETD